MKKVFVNFLCLQDTITMKIEINLGNEEELEEEQRIRLNQLLFLKSNILSEQNYQPPIVFDPFPSPFFTETPIS